MRHWSLRGWLGGLAAAVAVPLVLLVVGLFYIETQHEESAARDTALQIARANGERLRALHADSLAMLDRVASRPAIQQPGEDCDPFFTIVEYIPQYVNVFFFGPDGNVRCEGATTASDRLVSNATRAWATRELRAGRLVSKRAVTMAVAGRWIVILPYQMPHAGMMVLVESPEALGTETLPPTSEVAVFDGETAVATRSRSLLWSNRERSDVPVHAMARQREGQFETSSRAGISWQYGFTRVDGLGWDVYVGIPTEDVTRHVWRFLWKGLPAGVAIGLFVAGLALFFARRIQKPIDALARATISDDARVSVDGPREIASLATTFNEMMERRARADVELRESERAMKALSEKLLAAEEEQRKRIAREIHDDLGQSLTALKMDVIGLLDSNTATPASAQVRERILRTLDATVTAVQRIAAELRPAILDDLGLAAAIESEARLFEERTGIECEVSIPGDDELRVEPACAVAMYRIIQEALTNVSRHSDATRVELRVRRRAAEILLEIRDDGRGVSEDEIRDPLSLGLVGMRERASILGGSVHVEGVAGRGTIVSVRIPA